MANEMKNLLAGLGLSEAACETSVSVNTAQAVDDEETAASIIAKVRDCVGHAQARKDIALEISRIITSHGCVHDTEGEIRVHGILTRFFTKVDHQKYYGVGDWKYGDCFDENSKYLELRGRARGNKAMDETITDADWEKAKARIAKNMKGWYKYQQETIETQGEDSAEGNRDVAWKNPRAKTRAPATPSASAVGETPRTTATTGPGQPPTPPGAADIIRPASKKARI